MSITSVETAQLSTSERRRLAAIDRAAGVADVRRQMRRYRLKTSDLIDVGYSRRAKGAALTKINQVTKVWEAMASKRLRFADLEGECNDETMAHR
jgi:hypothetical protein